MLEFLQTGKAVYVLAAVCVLGVISKLVASSFYKSLIRETGNMALTKNKNLKALKQKTENMFLVNRGIRNITAYIDRQVYGFKLMKISLDGWDNLSIQAMILCFLLGGTAAFGSYWYRCDSYYIVLYGTLGILSGLFLVFVDNGANIAGKRQQLTDCLVDYVENSPHFYKAVEQPAENVTVNAEKRNKAAISTVKPRLRETVRVGAVEPIKIAAAEETSPATGKEKSEERKSRFYIEEDEVSEERMETDKKESAQGERQGGRLSVLSKRKEKAEPAVPKGKEAKAGDNPGKEEDELERNISYLQKSLEQIAASREHRRREDIWPEEKVLQNRGTSRLRPEDIKMLGEILQEYLT